MAVPFSQHLAPAATIGDCMDERSAFANAPPALADLEAGLMAGADVVTRPDPRIDGAEGVGYVDVSERAVPQAKYHGANP